MKKTYEKDLIVIQDSVRKVDKKQKLTSQYFCEVIFVWKKQNPKRKIHKMV